MHERFCTAVIIIGLFAPLVANACRSDSEFGRLVNERYGKGIEFDVLWNGNLVGEHVTSFTLTTDAMYDLQDFVLESLRKSFEDPVINFLLITHGWSTSRRGKITARSAVRSLMRSPVATPYIVRSQSIQHTSVFVAAIRHNPYRIKPNDRLWLANDYIPH